MSTETLPQNDPEISTPTAKHHLLGAFTGEWESEGEIIMGPDIPTVQIKGTETSRMIGGFWFIADIRSLVTDMPYEQTLTIGYDVSKKKYIGTVVDSMTSYLWHQEGDIDATGKILTMETQGPCPNTPGELSTYREVTELKTPDHKYFTSSILADDGNWYPVMKINLYRKK